MEQTESASRQTEIGRAFVALADTLVSDYDLVELLQRLIDTCTSLLDADSGGLLLVNERGDLQLLASTSEAADFVELVQIGAQEGPCFECFRTGRPVTIPDIRTEAARWPEFAAAAASHGLRSVHATPMRLRDDVIGTMNLFGSRTGSLGPEDVRLAQALTDVATIGILQERLLRKSQVVSEQLQSALSTRVVIEQAKGVLAALAGLSVDQSFQVMRAYARRNNVALRLVAAGVVDRTLDVLEGQR